MTQRICNDLIEAYKGYYADEIPESIYSDPMNYELEIKTLIEQHTPKERLEVYLTWNGILGWTNRIWEISQGEIYVG